MAKNAGYDPTDYARQQENIRKAKGNPNKNIHHKKNGSNYGGVNRPASNPSAPARNERKPLFDLPKPAKVVLGILAVVIIVMLIVWQTAFRDNMLMYHAVSVLVGLTCCLYVYFSYTYQKERKTLQTVVLVIIGILGVLYLIVGGNGLFTLIRG